MDGVDKIAALKKTALFGDLADHQLQVLADRAVEKHLAPGKVLFLAGQEARGVFVVVRGALRAFRVGVDGREMVIHVERAGATVAEVPAFDDRPYPSTVAADEDTDLLFIDKEDVRRICLEHPQIALAALKVLAGRLRRCSDLVEDLSLREVGQRIGRLLLAEGRHRGKRDGHGIQFELTMTNQQLAARVGSVREVVSRALVRLQDRGLIQVKGRKCTIVNETGLSAYAEE